MPLLACYALPHPPVLVPEIGQGEEKAAIATSQSYQQVANEIASLRPDTIVVVSPHANCYSDCFMISGAKTGTASFSHFRHSEVKLSFDYDTDLTNRILNLASRDDFPCYREDASETDFSYDHGSLVPLYFIQKAWSNFRIVRIAISGLPYAYDYQLGKLIKEAISQTNKRVVFIGSGDLSHCQKDDGPYGFKAIGPKYDQAIMETMTKGDFLGLLGYDPLFVDDAEVCGHPSFCVLAGTLDRKQVEIHAYSHEAPFGVGYGVISYHPGETDEGRDFLTAYFDKQKKDAQDKANKEDPYVALARNAIRSYLVSNMGLRPSADLPQELLTAKAGAFVSLHKFGCLRGCIGTTGPTQDSLAQEIISNAISAATRDPRFDPVEKDELPYLDISVDVLSPYEPIASKKDLDVKKYGVIVRNGNRSGLLLPDLEGVNSPDEQIRIAKRKAGIAEGEPVELFRFTVTRHV
jgi:AmmeMemoRadiSam system protein A/AmmeMemoRadiSam system protein B